MVAYADNDLTLYGLVRLLGGIDSLLAGANDRQDLERVQELEELRATVLAPHRTDSARRPSYAGPFRARTA